MARMNWDRVRGENQLARYDDYTTRYERAESSAALGPPDRRLATGKSKTAGKAERDQRIARSLGITVEKLKQARVARSEAHSAIKGTTFTGSKAERRKERNRLVAKRMGWSLERLEQLEAAEAAGMRSSASPATKGKTKKATTPARRARPQRPKGTVFSSGKKAKRRPPPSVGASRVRTAVCSSCGRPISVSGRCGCS